MTEDDVVNIVLAVLDVVVRKHQATGRHELNRTDLAAAVAELKVLGLPLEKKQKAA